MLHMLFAALPALAVHVTRYSAPYELLPLPNAGWLSDCGEAVFRANPICHFVFEYFAL